jgi:hypothetical protein
MESRKTECDAGSFSGSFAVPAAPFALVTESRKTEPRRRLKRNSSSMCGPAAWPFALLMQSRKTECGAGSSWRGVARAAPFALLRVFPIAILLVSACLGPLSAEIIDRIAITAGNQVITESQIDEEIRISAFLNREKPDVSAEARKQAASRLIEQALVRREMELSHYPLPQAADADAALAGIKANYPSPAEFAAALESDGITEADLTRRLLWQFTLLRFIDYRFRPGIQIPNADVQTYYRQEVSGWEQKGVKPIPTLEDSRDQIEEILTQKRIDQALDQWLAGARKQAAVTYRDATLAVHDATPSEHDASKE